MKPNGYKAKQLLWAGIFLLVAAILLITYASRRSITSSFFSYERSRLEKSLGTRQASASKAISTLISDSLFVKETRLTSLHHDLLRSLAEEKIGLAVYRQGAPIAWNTNSPGPDEFNPYAEYNNEPLNLTSGVYICNSTDTLGLQFISAIKVYEWFSIKNQYLQPKTVPESSAFKDISSDNTTEYQIKFDGKTLYSLQPNKGMKKQFGWFVLAALLAIAISANNMLKAFDWGKFWWMKLLAAPITGVLLLYGTTFAFPEIIRRLPPWLFNHNLSSINIFLQISFVVVFSIPIFTSAIGAKRLARWSQACKGIILPGMLLALAAFTAGVAQIVMGNLLQVIGPIGGTGSIDLTPSMLGLLAIVLLGWGMLLLIKSAQRLIAHAKTSTVSLIAIALVAAGVTAVLPYSNTFIRIAGTVGAILPTLLLWVSIKNKTVCKFLPSFIAIAISVILSLQFICNNQINTENTLEKIAKELAVDHDCVLESKVKKLLPKLEKDSTITALLKEIPKSLGHLNQYIGNTYFKDYLARYDFQITACPKGSKLIVNDTPQKVDCHNFFVEMATLVGRPIVTNRFYFLNSSNGRISYLFMGKYSDGKGGDNFLAIEIYSKATLNLPGYPSLLSNKTENTSTDLPTDVSYAKYSGTTLETKVGKYPYPLKRPEYLNCTGTSTNNNFYHVTICSDNQHMVVISKEKPSLLFLLSPLVYIFLGAYILATLAFRHRSKGQRNIFTLQKRIRRLAVMLMVISMLAVGAISLGYELSRQNASLVQGITEKMRSAVTITEPKVQQLTATTWNTGEIDSILIATSNILYADLNIYSPNGDLMGTSRHEVFSNKLQGYSINPAAYTAIMVEKRDFTLITEQVGSLQYTSAYAPLINKSGDIIAIINLPYFTKENEIREETMTLVGRIANAYLLLAILAGLLGYYAAYNISKPLQGLKKAMRKTSIAGQPELLEYRDNDEIGHLVREYNRMAAELSSSAQLLAQSEKEKVWREMARQIAHEIKNPLTPIKLSLQQLVRVKKDGSLDWDKRFDDFSKMLLEQVDILAKTASQFSFIAMDASTNSEAVDMTEIVERTISLFAGEPVTFENQFASTTTAPIVFADRKLMQKAITNLVSNALQASAENPRQKVSITLQHIDNLVQVSITDNGIGIAPSLQPRIFEPYFTTKSGGTGLGLVLVRKTIEESGGTIWFESIPNAGTTFFIRLPLHSAHDNND